MQNLILAGVDAIVVVAVDGDGTPAITKLASEAKIPVVYASHPPADVDSLPETAAFVASNGWTPAQQSFLADAHQGHPRRHRSGDCKGMKVIEEQSANWDRLEATNIMTNWLSAGTRFDAVIANDEMATGTIQAMKSTGVDMSKVVVAGIDATPNGLAAMAQGDLDVTAFQNAVAQGAAAMDAAVALARGEKTERHIWVPFELVTPQNMKDYAKANQQIRVEP